MASGAQRAQMPGYHLRPESNWINDPLGFTKVGDLYHLFYQYNPLGAESGVKHWGHATTRDLVDWEILPLALSPSQGGPDEDGCWSGSITTRVEPPLLFYTGVSHDMERGRIESVCLATGDPELGRWKKRREVLIPGPPVGLATVGFRDPFVWSDGEGWCLLLGSGIRGSGGAVLLYRSRDLLSWTYDGVFFATEDAPGDDDMGAMWECPQLLKVGDRQVLLLSVDNASRPVFYAVGGVEGSRFVAERIGRLDLGPEFYAPTCVIADGGRPLLIAWAAEARSEASQIAAGWAGVMTLPRELALTPDGRLCSRPAAELARLRARRWMAAAVSLPSGADVVFPVGGSRVEIAATVRTNGASLVGLRVRMSPDRREMTVLSVDLATGRVSFDRSTATLAPDAVRGVYHGRDTWLPGERVHLRAFVDESIVEFFVDDSLVLTGRIYPVLGDSLGIAAFSVGGAAEIESIEVWQLSIGAGRDATSVP